VQGNPELRAEEVADAEGGVVFSFFSPRPVRVRAVAHGSRLDDAVVLINRSAFTVVPENTGVAWRAGLDLDGEASVIDGVTVGSVASVLLSYVEATGATLPQAPPFSLRTFLRVGDPLAHVDVVVTARGASASNLFGTLVSPGSTLVDLRGRWPLAEQIGVTATVQNALDVRDARDTNLLPLPGRLVFFGFEIDA
jgi:outer membrane receptor protein involved in Fe transport